MNQNKVVDAKDKFRNSGNEYQYTASFHMDLIFLYKVIKAYFLKRQVFVRFNVKEDEVESGFWIAKSGSPKIQTGLSKIKQNPNRGD